MGSSREREGRSRKKIRDGLRKLEEKKGHTRCEKEDNKRGNGEGN